MRTNKLLIFCALFLIGFLSNSNAIASPVFVYPGTQTLTICENTVEFNLNSYLAAIDSDSLVTLEWLVYTAPANGSMPNYYDLETSTGGIVSPVSFFYTPVTGFSGNDSLIIELTDGVTTVYDTINIVVSPLPHIGTISGINPLCVGSTYFFSDSTSDGSGTWASSNGFASVDGDGGVFGVSAGTDTIMYIQSNTCGTDTASYVLSINNSFSPAVTIGANPGYTSCAGVPVTYFAVPVNGGALPAFQWTVNGITTAYTDTFIYTPNNDDELSVILTSDAACKLVSTASDSITLLVIPDVMPTISISSGYGDTVCIGATVLYSAATTYAGSSPSYLWRVNGTPYGIGSTFSYSPSNHDTISSVLTSNFTCATPANVASNNIIMSVDTAEIPSIIITAAPGDTVCLGSPVTFTTSVESGGLTPFFRWIKNGINVATGHEYSILVPATGDLVSCLLSSSATCASLDSVFSNTIQIKVDSPMIPTVAISSFSGVSVTPGAPDTIVATVTSAVNPTYQWSINGVPVPGATSAIFVAQDTATTMPSSITCAVTNNSICITTGISNTIVLEGTSGIQQTSLAGANVVLLPNPNKGTFVLQGTLSTGILQAAIEVTDIVGRVVYKDVTPVQNGMIKSQITLDNQAVNGIYLMHLIADNANEVIRFTLNR